MIFNKMPIVFFVFSILILENCSKKMNSSAAVGPLVALETGGCRGFCPMYKLEFSTDGRGDFEGIRFVEKLGKQSFQLTKTELAELQTAVKNANLFSMKDRYESRVVDLPNATLTAFENGKTKTVSGSDGLPKAATDLKNLMMKLATAHGCSLESHNPTMPDKKTAKTVIVELKKGVNAGNWLAQFQDLRLRLVRQLAPDRNLWLVEYDPNEVKEDALLDLLKSSKDTVNAQPNAEVKDRN